MSDRPVVITPKQLAEIVNGLPKAKSSDYYPYSFRTPVVDFIENENAIAYWIRQDCPRLAEQPTASVIEWKPGTIVFPGGRLISWEPMSRFAVVMKA